MNDTAEKCQGCTIKHLSEVLVWLDDNEAYPAIRGAYICGNLSHAANHFVHYSSVIADHIRQLRLEGINNDLTLALDVETFKTRLQNILREVSAFKEPVIEAPPAVKTIVETPKSTGGGCKCRQKS